ncbi:hypothetical protein LSAT2_024675 [Lamellibrachia satsuma]|nr:hypothetical protein LSAT2_024675 [Lamellibrachia satsuma]
MKRRVATIDEENDHEDARLYIKTVTQVDNVAKSTDWTETIRWSESLWICPSHVRICPSADPKENKEGDYDEIGDSATPEQESPDKRPGNIYTEDFSKPSQPVKDKFALSLPPRPATYKTISRQQSDSKVCSNRRLIILGIVITVVVIAILTGVIVYLTDKSPDTSTSTPTRPTPPTETIYGTMWLDALEYKPATYGNPNSTDYKQLKNEFCSKIMSTLSDSDLGKDTKTCNVTSFSKGSVKVHFQVVLKSGETTKEQLKDHLLKEMKKGEGQFNQYLKDPSAARLTMESAPEHITTSPTATPVVPTSSSAWPTTTTTSPTTHVVSTTSPEGPVTTNTGASSGTITMTSSSVNRSTERNESTHTTDTPTTTTSTTTTTPVRPYCERHRPCQHGGTCVSKGVDDYVCVCPRCGCYGGEPFHNCAIDKDNICSEDKFARDETLLPHPYNFVLLCVNVTCLNGGTCEDTLKGFVCHCPYGYTGRKCETRLIPCAELKCEHGTCQNTENGGSHCICHANYYGRLCNSSIRHCVDVTCLNGGMCRDTSHGFRCDCREGYTGRICETSFLHDVLEEYVEENRQELAPLTNSYSCSEKFSKLVISKDSTV